MKCEVRREREGGGLRIDEDSVDQSLMSVTLFLTFCVLLQVYVTLARSKNFAS